MTGDGSKVKGAANIQLTMQNQMEILRRTLQHGFNKDAEMDLYYKSLAEEEFQTWMQTLKTEPAFGYPFSPNYSNYYFLCNRSDEHYPKLFDFEPIGHKITQ
ncbi:hypothetical protein FCJ48_18280 [Salmonella enterica]|nr:hypothetical protein [Salmonella enterica]